MRRRTTTIWGGTGKQVSKSHFFKTNAGSTSHSTPSSPQPSLLTINPSRNTPPALTLWQTYTYSIGTIKDTVHNTADASEGCMSGIVIGNADADPAGVSSAVPGYGSRGRGKGQESCGGGSNSSSSSEGDAAPRGGVVAGYEVGGGVGGVVVMECGGGEAGSCYEAGRIFVCGLHGCMGCMRGVEGVSFIHLLCADVHTTPFSPEGGSCRPLLSSLVTTPPYIHPAASHPNSHPSNLRHRSAFSSSTVTGGPCAMHSVASPSWVLGALTTR